jgi:hypothetical protein
MPANSSPCRKPAPLVGSTGHGTRLSKGRVILIFMQHKSPPALSQARSLKHHFRDEMMLEQSHAALSPLE